MRFRVLFAAAAVPLVLWLFLPLVSQGQSGRIASLQSKIEQKRREAAAKRERERALSGDIAGYTRRIVSLQDDITRLQSRQVRIQADLDRKRAELADLQEDLRLERLRLERLRVKLAESRAALAVRLVELYKADEPDMVTVILQADGFNDLLERAEFMQRVGRQDARILERVRTAKAQSVASEAKLQKLEKRQQEVAARILAQRNEVAAIKGELVERRDGFAAVRADRNDLLQRVRASRRQIENHIDGLEAEQAKIANALAGTSPQSAGPIRPGASGLIWPVNGPITSPFGMRWGRLHAGVDIGAGEGTPIRAAASGKVVLLGWTGGYGNYTCVAHGGGLSTCYAHQSRYGTSNGASVKQGQVIGYVGNTGNSFGAHLHFETRINGQPVNPAGYL